jgi:hypothetical protein
MTTPEPVAPKPQARTIGIPIALALAAVPVLCYVYALQYEGSFAAWYGFPDTAVSLDASVLYSDLLILGIFLVAGIMVYAVLPRFLHDLLFRTWGFVLFSLSLANRPSTLSFVPTWWWVTTLTILGLVVVQEAVSVVLLLKRTLETKRSIFDLESTYRVELSPWFATKFRLDPSGSAWITVAIGTLFGLSSLASITGTRAARGQQEFYVVSGQPELLVLRVYHDRVVCATFDRKKHIVYRRFLVVPAIGDSVRLTWEHIGTMEVADAPPDMSRPTGG